MDEAQAIAEYLPCSFRTPSEEEYVAFLWDSFQTNYEHGKFQFAFLAYHMLAMSVVYCNIWQIRKARPQDFGNAMIGFARDEKALQGANTPFAFSPVQERSILRILRLIGCDNSMIGTCAKLVDARNDTAHANGHIFFSTRGALDVKLNDVLRVLGQIEKHAKPVVEQIYSQFLLDSSDPEEREYYDAADQIREALIHDNYFSQRDIEICLGFDLASLADRPEIDGMCMLHEALVSNYVEGED